MGELKRRQIRAADQSCRPAPGQDLLYLSTPGWVFPGTELCSGCTHQHYRCAEPDPAETATPVLLPIQEKTHPHPAQASSRTLLIACFLCLLGDNSFIGSSKTCTSHRGEPDRQTGGCQGRCGTPQEATCPWGPGVPSDSRRSSP